MIMMIILLVDDNVCCITSIGVLTLIMLMRTIFVVQQTSVGMLPDSEGLVREGRIREPYLHCFGNEDAFVNFDD